jgi:hypothetical protein
MHSQRMASIALIVIGCIDYLAYGTIFTRVMFRPKIKLDVFFPARKAADEHWEHGQLTTARQTSWAFLAGSQKLAFLFPPSQTETPHA